MWRYYVQTLVFVGVFCVSVMKSADASPHHEVPRLTFNISCASTYSTAYDGGEGDDQLNALPPCQFHSGDIALFGNSNLRWNIVQGLFWIEAIDGTGIAWSTPQFVPWTRLEFQADGNLVIYDEHRAVWSSNTWAGCQLPDNFKTLTFQKDGNLVIYCRNPEGGSVPMWSTNTWIRE
jgi:hypothetical protein